eukprot:1122296-Alexandrium_andersonii.AAC.1
MGTFGACTRKPTKLWSSSSYARFLARSLTPEDKKRCTSKHITSTVHAAFLVIPRSVRARRPIATIHLAHISPNPYASVCLRLLTVLLEPRRALAPLCNLHMTLPQDARARGRPCVTGGAGLKATQAYPRDYGRAVAI